MKQNFAEQLIINAINYIKNLVKVNNKGIKKNLKLEGMEKREPSYTVGGNVNWYRHYGEQYGGSLKN